MGTIRWTDDQLKNAVLYSKSIRSVIIKLGLIPAGGNYVHITRRINELNLNTSHFTGKGWNINGKPPVSATPLTSLLVKSGQAQSYKLKKRLFNEGLLEQKCQLCGWAESAADGRIPVELDHINGDRTDNRIDNLRILCPNCHSLQPTHRGLNQLRHRYISSQSHARVVE